MANQTEAFNGLAQELLRADDLKRQAAHKREQAERAEVGLKVAAMALCGDALEELSLCEPWPTSPDFQKLMGFLRKSTNVSRVCEGIEREIEWCQGLLGENAPHFDELSIEATAICERYRTQMIEYATKLLADGESLDEEAISLPSIHLEALSRADDRELGELLREVRAAYEKFRRVVGDNGPFSLQPTTNPDEDVKLAEELGILREANAKPYLGPLDDNFMGHVDAFWEGFVKLGQTCESKASANLAPMVSYFSLMVDELSQALAGKRLANLDTLSMLDAIPKERE